MPATVKYLCRDCGRENLRWEGRCPGCDAWNSLDEVAVSPKRGRARSANGAAPRALGAVETGDTPRRLVGLGEVDRVLGGGLVPGSVLLLGGAPGVGKSTLLLQVAGRIAAGGGSVLYISGEESEEQVRGRAIRLGEGATDVLFLAETAVSAIVTAAEKAVPDLLCVDSIQTTVTDQGTGAPGSVSQVRDAADSIREFAKRSGIPTVIVGHVTKGGGIAGPRTLEHIVDVVMQFEGGESARLLRATKNRFGRVGELAVFSMENGGLVPVSDPGHDSVRNRRPLPGSAMTATIEGARPIMAEVQALTTQSTQNVPRRMTTGFSSRRLAMLLAVLERRGGVPLGSSEVFVNVVGGFRVTDPVADAAVLAALATAELDRVIPAGTAFLGEAGLSGELRPVRDRATRLLELERAGITDVVIAGDAAGSDSGDSAALRIHPVAGVRELVGWVLANATKADES
jgi:DNA repair protein RadA/Sms